MCVVIVAPSLSFSVWSPSPFLLPLPFPLFLSTSLSPSLVPLSLSLLSPHRVSPLEFVYLRM